MELRGMKVLVTGGAGFIGSHLVEALVEKGAEVTVIDSSAQGSSGNLKGCLADIDYHRVDVLGLEVQDLIARRGFHLIYHLASNSSVPSSVEDPGADLSFNTLATFRLLETLRRRSPETRLVYFSSAAVYGSPREVPFDETAPLAPISPHGVSKLAADRYVSVFSHLYGIKAAILRPFSVYGPRLRRQVVHDLIKKVDGNPDELRILGDGSQIRDFCYVDDVVNAALITAAMGQFGGEVYHVASGIGCSIGELARLICDVMGARPRFVFAGTARSGEPQEWVADIAKLKALGYSPRVDLPDGISRTYKWYTEARHANSRGEFGRQMAEESETSVRLP